MAIRTEQERLERLLLGQEILMSDIHLLLAEEQKQDDLIRALVRSATGSDPVRIRGLDPDRVFDLDSIKALCIRYRLRFLPGKLYKGSIHNQAVHAIRRLERKAETPLSGFLFMAPSTQFKLCDSEVDPLLFVPLGDDRFYLVHKWGNDLDRARAILNWPFRSAIHLATMVVLVGIVLAMLVPTSLISMDPQAGFWGAHRIIMMFWTVMVCASFTVFGWFAFFGQFSTEAWNSRYFN
ncbi:MAG: hypothetical protein IPN30_04810 [Flavobacteriales bacterium]|nr:hypothetical protein [Flavobacteriales bacterium]